MTPIIFKAPWSKALRRKSFVATTVCLMWAGIAAFANFTLETPVRVLLAGTPLLILFIALLFSIRDYTLTETELRIRRCGWVTRFLLRDLKSVEGNADAWQESFRVAGNNGLFAFTGWRWSKRLKLHRFYATDPARAVVLRFKSKTAVITPHDPQAFIMRVRTLLKTADFPL